MGRKKTPRTDVAQNAIADRYKLSENVQADSIDFEFPPNAIPEKYKLSDIYLVRAFFSRDGVKGGRLPGDLELSIRYALGKSDDHADDLVTHVTLRLIARYEANTPAVMTIEATFLIAFRPPEMLAMYSEDEIRTLAEGQAILHVWPYWREFVRSEATRMGLPVLKLPLLFPAGLKFTVADGV